MKKVFKYSIVLLLGLVLLSNTSFITNTSNTMLSKLNIDTYYNTLIIKKDEMSFGVSTEKPNDADFFTNSNFFNDDASIGLVVINKHRVQKRVKNGGYFYVVNGKPYVRVKSCPSMTDFASQTLLWGIDNGRVNTPLINSRKASLKKYRTIMGETSNGDIMIISSNRIGLVTTKEIIEYAQSKGMVEGILLDGGSSVDYKFNDGVNERTFQSIPSTLKPFLKIDEPKTYIFGNFIK